MNEPISIIRSSNAAPIPTAVLQQGLALVARERAADQERTQVRLELGRLALSVCGPATHGGDRASNRSMASCSDFAAALGLHGDTLADYRTVAQAWGDEEVAVPPVSWSALRVLAGVPAGERAGVLERTGVARPTRQQLVRATEERPVPVPVLVLVPPEQQRQEQQIAAALGGIHRTYWTVSFGEAQFYLRGEGDDPETASSWRLVTRLADASFWGTWRVPAGLEEWVAENCPGGVLAHEDLRGWERDAIEFGQTLRRWDTIRWELSEGMAEETRSPGVQRIRDLLAQIDADSWGVGDMLQGIQGYRPEDRAELDEYRDNFAQYLAYAAVAEMFPPERRVAGLSWADHGALVLRREGLPDDVRAELQGLVDMG